MTETTTVDTTPTETRVAPSTAETAAQVIDAFDQTETTGGDLLGEGDTPTPPIETAPVVAETPAAVQAPRASPEDAEIEALLAEHGFKDVRKPDGREHYIPRSKVLKMIGSGLKRGQERWTTERGVVEAQVRDLAGHLDQLRRGVAGDPQAFLAELAGHDPRYQRFLTPAPAAAPGPVSAAIPEPDYTLPDGSKTYSLTGIQQALIPWLTQTITADLEATVDRRLKPVTDREQRAAADATATAQMTEASTWPMFGALAADGTLTPFQQEVLEELHQDSTRAAQRGQRPLMTLRQGYLEVYARHQDPAKVRERFVAELKQAPRSPALVRGTTDAPTAPAPATTADIASRVIDRLERRG